MEKKKTKYNWAVHKTKVEDPVILERVKSLTDIKFLPAGITKEQIYTCARLNIGYRFYIVKTKSLAWLEIELNKCLKTYAISGLKRTNMFYPIIKYIYDKGYYDIQVDIICQSDNAYQVIKEEFLALKKAEGDNKCLNVYYEPYVSKYKRVEGLPSYLGVFGWLTFSEYGNFMKFVKKHKAKTALK